MQAKLIISLSILLATFCANTKATVLYVDDDANGVNDGTSWENAYTYLQDAIAGAKKVTKPVEIRIAQGTYKPDQGDGFTLGDREATFELVHKINLAGGYAGLGNSDPNAHDIELYETILSGDLNNNDIKNPDIRRLDTLQTRQDNSFRVITSRYLYSSNYIDGLTIISGNANDPSYVSGGGIYNYYSDLTISNCTFKENSAPKGGGLNNYDSNSKITNCKFLDNMAIEYGGGVYNYNSTCTITNCTIKGNYSEIDGSGMYNAQSTFILTNCTFESNIAKSNGGAITNDKSNPSITDCTFNTNEAKVSGGGIYNSDDSNPAITNCTFSENIVIASGGAIYNDSKSDPIITSCTFTSNSADQGAGICNHNQSKPTISGCTFNSNKADSLGAAICNESNSDPVIENCTFTENISHNLGGAIYSESYCDPTITKCTFNKNSAQKGGGLYNNNNSPTLTDCTFTENTGTSEGGGIYNSHSNLQIFNCIFNKNSALDCGAGMTNDHGYPIITGCTFSENISNQNGGGIYNKNYSVPDINNCSFTKNQAEISGGGIFNLSTNPILTDCTFIENYAGNNGAGMFNDKSELSITNCMFRKNTAENNGGGLYNISSNTSSFEKCLFIENISGISGGAIYNKKCNTILPNSIFLGNTSLYGGGINNSDKCKITITNCTFEGNAASFGNAISCYSISESQNEVSPCNINITSCILWDEDKELFNDGDSSMTITYCDIKGAFGNSYDPNENIIFGDGIIETDPCFVSPGYWIDDANDTFYHEGDYHLKSNAGRYDPNSSNWIIDDMTSPCIDTGNPITPLYYELYPNGARINMGAYGGTLEASKSLNETNYFSKADSPEPYNNAFYVALDAMLKWSSDSNAIQHELYLGTDSFPPFARTLNKPEFDPGALQQNTQYYWRIDNLDNALKRVSGDIWTFTTGSTPGYAFNSNPRDGDKVTDYNITLTWNPGANRYTRYHNVYLGTNYEVIYFANMDNPLDVLVANSIDVNYYNPGNLEFNQTYYWRVDEYSGPRGNTTIIGDIWSFTTGSEPPAQAYYPYPADNAVDVPWTVILSWSPGTFNPDSYDVYFGDNFNDVHDATIANPLNCLVSIAQDANYYDPGEFFYPYQYYWRVDQTDSNGLVLKGKIWSFEIIRKRRSCFTSDTPVWVDGKMLDISKVQTGQKIGKEDSAMSISGSVQGLEEHGAGFNPCYEMTLESGNTITIVHSHYFKTVSGDWKKIEELSAGMQLQTMNGPITIKSVTKKEKPFLGKSYNLITEGSEQYYVGIDGVIALDCSKKTWEILEEARK